MTASDASRGEQIAKSGKYAPKLAVVEPLRDGMTEDDGMAEEMTDGAQVLNKVEVFLRRFCVLPGEHCYVAVTLWAAHTHFISRLETTPRLACLSPEPSSGKTRVLEVLDLVCANPLMALDISMSAFFRIVEDRQPSILLDEVDAIFLGKKQSESTEDMRRVINNGYRVGAVVQRVGGKNRDEVQNFRVFTPVAMAGLGNLPDTLMSRSVILKMKPRRGSEMVEPFRDRLHRPEGQELQRLMARWAAAVETMNYPDLPEGVEDRDADVWEPLLMVADIAGGDWPERARKSCLKFLAEKPDSSVSLGVRLLADLKKVWPENAAVMTTADILNGLAKQLDEAPWADLYGEGLKPRKLAQLLSDYDIKSRDVRTAFGVRKGYRREDLWDAWLRYVPLEMGDIRDRGDIPGQGVAVPRHRVADIADSVAEDKGIRDAPTCGIADVADVADSGGRSEGLEASDGQPPPSRLCHCGIPAPPDRVEHFDCERKRLAQAEAIEQDRGTQ